MNDRNKIPLEKKRDEALVERLLRRALENFGAVLDRKLGREAEVHSGFTTSTMIERMRGLINERVREDAKRGRIAPHLLQLKIEWGTHAEAPPEVIQELEHEILAAAIDHINDARLRTLAPVRVETIADIFTIGIVVDPSYGEFAKVLQEEDEAAARKESGVSERVDDSEGEPDASVRITARVSLPAERQTETVLVFQPGGRRLNVGRATDNDLSISHGSVSKVHAVLRMNADNNLILADTGSTNGTFINGRRLAYGEARIVADNDTVGFGDVETRFSRQ